MITTDQVSDAVKNAYSEVLVNNLQLNKPFENKFTVVTRKKRYTKPKAPLIRGTAEDSVIRGVMKYAYLHAYRLDPTLKAENVKNCLLSKNIGTVMCEQLNSKYPEEYSSFKVSLPAEKVEEARNPSLWPTGVCIDHFLLHLGQNKAQK